MFDCADPSLLNRISAIRKILREVMRNGFTMIGKTMIMSFMIQTLHQEFKTSLQKRLDPSVALIMWLLRLRGDLRYSTSVTVSKR